MCWCKDPDRGLPAPDAVFYLNISIGESKSRGGYGEERYEKEEIQAKVKTIFEEKLKDSTWVIFDAAKKSREVLHDEIKLEAIKCIEVGEKNSLRGLWEK